jgi:uncharacterized protein (TIGR03067 family)
MQTALLLGAAFALSAPALKDPPKKPHNIVGEWVVESMVTAGKARPQTAEPLKYVFTADGKWLLYRGERKVGDTQRGYSTDTNKDTPTIDLTLDLSDQETRKTFGIYKVEGDKLTLCIGRVNSDRPKAFEATPEAPATLYVFKRVK